jgi:hypothetical protein
MLCSGCRLNFVRPVNTQLCVFGEEDVEVEEELVKEEDGGGPGGGGGAGGEGRGGGRVAFAFYYSWHSTLRGLVYVSSN